MSLIILLTLIPVLFTIAAVHEVVTDWNSDKQCGKHNRAELTYDPVMNRWN